MKYFFKSIIFIFTPYIALSSEMPPSSDGITVRTLNAMGTMWLEKDPLEQRYLEELQPEETTLEIGCAYGYRAREAAQKGTKVCANYPI